ncbi:MAG TPA: CHAT domain-containing protein, partial [Pirellulaceae bacterium]|nr:CHAT domain-containing protein [Pirellulaceae bacterium]
FEHPLSAMALVELGKLHLATGQFEAAGTYFLEATYSAAVFGQYDVIEEGFRGAVITHLVSGKKDFFAPLLPAGEWARRLSPALETSIRTLSAENLAALGETQRAMVLLTEARRAAGRHDFLAGAIGARYQYELAKVNYQLGNLAAGNTALGLAMGHMTGGGSRRLFQILLADGMCQSNSLSERVADQLYSDVLREVGPADWSIDPMETMAVVMTPRALPMEHWFLLALKRGDPEKALEIADRMKRWRFFGSLPLGGRTLALRWVLAGPTEVIGDRPNQQRRDLLAKYPRYAELSRKADEVRKGLAKEPLVIENPDALKDVQTRFDALTKMSAEQELVFHEMALQRNPSDFVFPPLLIVKDLQQKLLPGTLVLAYFQGSSGLYGFAISKEKYNAWRVDSPAKLRAEIADMMRKLGLRDRTQPVDIKDLRDEAWKTIAKKLLPSLTNGAKAEVWNDVRDLVIVPDGMLWYLPFEMLPLGEGDSEQPMMLKVPMRYVPTVGLAGADGRKLNIDGRTGAVAGRMYPREDLQTAAGAVEQLGGVLPNVTRLPNKLPGASSMVSKMCDRLVVYHDMEDTEKSPYDWSPVQIDKAKAGSSLSAHLAMPWGGPAQVVFPGFHTAAEVALKKAGANGDEVYFTICGLMGNGARSVLLSRWRVGGQSSYDLTREFMQELPHKRASLAWQRSVQLRMQSELDPAVEPRLKLGATDEPLKPTHPFFWAGYMLADLGDNPVRPDEKE